ncbi:hypothetical protein CVU82_00670 [Candidatus Falkowbacteria bacterium HGW-Falkowbacteria-1]|jgi:DNA-binding protein HU-beta|uniref:Integration host factor subunit alpha n=1 Tax=Candidatus Falkowbacteria bacterium HGW-Falkowbacteria-1 TaxID=2013768 RepID=A0A2N2EAK3_9BACT|nr:MAG: hypothetical protein CVU82_00670 [Candidatus Falkowbacteria bacterium HGW-Falkowbacteria-1]
MKRNINKTINQKDLAEIVSKKHSNPNIRKKEVEKILKIAIDEIIEQLGKDFSVKLTSFGTFSVKTRYARGGVNPRNPKERIKIPSVKVAKFKSGKKLKDSLKA